MVSRISSSKRFNGLLTALWVVVVAGATEVRAQDSTPEATLSDTVRGVLARMDTRPVSELWDTVERLTQLDAEEVVPILRRELQSKKQQPKLACAAALLKSGEREVEGEALAALVELIDSSKDLEIRVAAVQLLGEYGDPDDTVEFLTTVLEKATRPTLIVPVARTLWSVDNVAEARARLLELLSSRDHAVKVQAALALAEIDYFEGEVRDILRRLQLEPTLRGRLAAALLYSGQLARRYDREIESGAAVLPGVDEKALLRKKVKQLEEDNERLADLQRDLERQGGAGRSMDPGIAVVDEVLRLIRSSYLDNETVSRRDLVVSALRGVARALDPFSSFMDPEDSKKFSDDLDGEYCGIGAQIHKPGAQSPLEIVKPMYKGPAYEAGILTGDKVLEIDGVPTMDLKTEEIVGRLKGKKDTVVTLKIFRVGWDQTRDFEITRRIIEVPMVTWSMLPESIAVVTLTQFGNQSANALRDAVFKLKEQGAEGIILDLRHNPGGLLPDAVDIVDLFVDSNEFPIVTQRGPGEETGVQTFANPGKLDDPLVVLIDDRSASASEVVSGALRDFHRATLVGTSTFGKGSVQRLFPLSPQAQTFLGGEPRSLASMRLTVQLYYLPSGECIHSTRDATGKVIKQGGVSPDIEVPARSVPRWLRAEQDRIRSSEDLVEYVRKHFDAIKHLVVDGDGGQADVYPDFETLYEKVKDGDPEKPEDVEAREVPRDAVRETLRMLLRRHYEDSIGRELAGDFQFDPQLQQGILEMLKKFQRDPADTKYAWMAELQRESTDADEEKPAKDPKTDKSKTDTKPDRKTQPDEDENEDEGTEDKR